MLVDRVALLMEDKLIKETGTPLSNVGRQRVALLMEDKLIKETGTALSNVGRQSCTIDGGQIN